MRLYLHNFLQDNIDSTTLYPLTIAATQTQIVPAEFNEELIDSFIKRLDVSALAGACRDLGIPFEIPANIEYLDEEAKRQLHHILFEVDVVSGELFYMMPDGQPKRRFPIICGIPDMCNYQDCQAEVAEAGEEEDDE